MSFTILIVDDEKEVCISLSKILISKGFNTIIQENPLNVIDIINHKIDLILMDIRMPQLGGIDLLKKIKNKTKSIPIIMISGHATVDNAVMAMKYGAINLYTKPINLNVLLSEINQIKNSNSIKIKTDVSESIVTNNVKMKELLILTKKAAPTEAAVIITGESGVGKELIADTLHNLSNRKNSNYIKINCAAIPDNLLESEMFGHEPGAFTDAKTLKRGKFEMAGGGTIFLDEIGDMSLTTQAKMLRVLEERKYTRLGGVDTINADCRIISASNKDFKKMIELGSFREDLYYRLSVISLHVPSLRERKEDIIILAEYFLANFNKIYNKTITDISHEVKTVFLHHNWPGNIRELKNIIQRAVIFCDNDILELDNFSEQYKKIFNDDDSESLQDRYNTNAKEVILDALNKTDGVKQHAASLLKITRKTLYNRMKKYNLK